MEWHVFPDEHSEFRHLCMRPRNSLSLIRGKYHSMVALKLLLICLSNAGGRFVRTGPRRHKPGVGGTQGKKEEVFTFIDFRY